MRLSNKYVFLISFFILISCNQQNEIERTLTCSKNEYWSYKDNLGVYGIYFQFHADGTYDKYNRYPDGFALFNNDTDVISVERNWHIQGDTLLKWDSMTYKIEKTSRSQIVLSQELKEHPKRIVTLTKIKD